jgi:hypothetical protein
MKKNSLNVNFLLQNRHLKPITECKKWTHFKHDFFQNYDFAFANLLKNEADMQSVNQSIIARKQ